MNELVMAEKGENWTGSPLTEEGLREAIVVIMELVFEPVIRDKRTY
jgi:hypothetical protein